MIRTDVLAMLRLRLVIGCGLKKIVDHALVLPAETVKSPEVLVDGLVVDEAIHEVVRVFG